MIPPHSPQFGLGQNSVTIKRVGHGWVRAYHFETRTIKVFLSLWDKHAIMPPMRIAVSFDGRITTHDHIPTFYLRALSPPPHFRIRFFLFLYLRIYRIKSPISISPLLFTFAPHWRHRLFSHPLEFHAFLRPPDPLLPHQRFPPLHWDLNTCLNSRNGISNNTCLLNHITFSCAHVWLL